MAQPGFYKENTVQNTLMSCQSISHSDDPSENAALISLDRLRAEFLHAWNGYKQYAWGHDELKPQSKTYFDWYPTTLLITPVDAFDTMILMGLTAEPPEAFDFETAVFNTEPHPILKSSERVGERKEKDDPMAPDENSIEVLDRDAWRAIARQWKEEQEEGCEAASVR